MSTRGGLPPWAIALGVTAAALVLAFHVRTYMFLTDDSFISFRYARNLIHGHGLVFNPGGDRVEGYTNLLWVLILAGLGALGLDLERTSIVLSIAATTALFAIVVGFVWTRAPRGLKWLALLPAFFLAATRSFAVWATSGLETRMFELLLVAGLLRLVREVDGLESEENEVRAISPWLLGLAALMRPDGVLIGGCAFLAAGIYLAWRTRGVPWRPLASWWPFVGLVGASLIFRLAYYGDWLPNTYYAKVGSHLSWARGLRYVAAFALEYAAFVWIPGLIAAVLWHLREKTLFLPFLFAAAILPHALYVTAIGGDHFEYRPLDIYFPLIFLLLADGARACGTSPARVWVVAGYGALIVFGLAWLPARSHAQFPSQYLPGFPGALVGNLPEADQFLDPSRDPVYRLPLLRSIARAHRDLVRDLTTHFGAIRQEEHRLFREKAEDAARRLNRVLKAGLLPRDTYMALDCVGVVPYRTDLRILDRLGLTDAHVAHGPFVRDVIAHGKYATMDYARECGVDLWSMDPVALVSSAGSSRLEEAIREAQAGRGRVFAADVDSGDFVFCLLPRGLEATNRRMPRLELRGVGEPSIARSYVDHYLPEFLGYVGERRVGPKRVQRLGEIALLAGDLKSATQIYETASRAWPRNWQFPWMLTICRHEAGDTEKAVASLKQAVANLREEGDPAPERLIELYRGLRPGAAARSPGQSLDAHP